MQPEATRVQTKLEELLADLRELAPRVIVVTGAQRSGTTIAARILAQELALDYVDEEDYGTKNLAGWRRLIAEARQAVIQSPAMARWVHEVATADVAVVWMLRPAREIEASIARIGWRGAGGELAKYDDAAGTPWVRRAQGQVFSQVKNAYWRQAQQPLIRHAFELQYRDLAGHPLFVEQARRAGFAPRQWRSEEAAHAA